MGFYLNKTPKARQIVCVKSFFEFEETTMKDSKNVKAPMKPLLKEPKRKHTNEQILTPFPVPVASIYVAGEDAEYKGYTGSLEGDSVVIECSKEAKSLYLRGYYGTVVSKATDSSSSANATRVYHKVQDFNFDELFLPEKEKKDDDEEDEKAPRSREIPEDCELVLTLEEAFFLSFAFGCLTVKEEQEDGGRRCLTVLQQLELFQTMRSPTTFIKHYVAYHHLRSKGMVPRCGMKYGVPFVAYHKGPAHYHSSYMIHVQANTEESLKWVELSALLRLATSVSKQLIIVNVAIPPASVPTTSVPTTSEASTTTTSATSSSSTAATFVFRSTQELSGISVNEVLASRFLFDHDEISIDGWRGFSKKS